LKDINELAVIDKEGIPIMDFIAEKKPVEFSDINMFCSSKRKEIESVTSNKKPEEKVQADKERKDKLINRIKSRINNLEASIKSDQKDKAPNKGENE